MISTLTMAALLLLWFRKILITSMSGVVTPIMPLNMLVIAVICAGLLGQKIHRRLM